MTRASFCREVLLPKCSSHTHGEPASGQTVPSFSCFLFCSAKHWGQRADGSRTGGGVHSHAHTLGRRGKKKKNRLHGMYVFPSLTLNHSISLSLTQKPPAGKAVAMGQHFHRHGAELVPRWWLVRQHNSNFMSPEVNALWTGRLHSPPTSVLHLHAPLYLWLWVCDRG